MRADRLRAVCFGVALLASLYVALRPSADGEDWFWQADKFRHALAFALLWALGRWAGVRQLVWLALGLLCFGVLIEGLQSLTPDRQPSAGDVLADAAGLWLGHALWQRLSRPAT